MRDPELYKQYKAWLREVYDDNASVEQWMREGFISWGDVSHERDWVSGEDGG